MKLPPAMRPESGVSNRHFCSKPLVRPAGTKARQPGSWAWVKGGCVRVWRYWASISQAVPAKPLPARLPGRRYRRACRRAETRLRTILSPACCMYELTVFAPHLCLGMVHATVRQSCIGDRARFKGFPLYTDNRTGFLCSKRVTENLCRC